MVGDPAVEHDSGQQTLTAYDAGATVAAGLNSATGVNKEDRRGRKNRYVAFKFEDDEDELPAGYVNPLSQTSGTDKDIAPVKRTDDGWDPRQW